MLAIYTKIHGWIQKIVPHEQFQGFGVELLQPWRPFRKFWIQDSDVLGLAGRWVTLLKNFIFDLIYELFFRKFEVKLHWGTSYLIRLTETLLIAWQYVKITHKTYPGQLKLYSLFFISHNTILIQQKMRYNVSILYR